MIPCIFEVELFSYQLQGLPMNYLKNKILISEAFLKNLLLPPSYKHRKEQMCSIKGETLFHVIKETVHLLLNIAW
jgi:hypothetical protein